MRWLIVAAIVIAAAASYLAWSLSTDSNAASSRTRPGPAPTPSPDPAPRTHDRIPTPTIKGAPEPARKPAPERAPEPKPTVPKPRDTSVKERPTPPPTAGSDQPAPPPIPLRQERLQEAEAYLAKSNFKGALEVGLHMMERYPGMMEGYRVSVAALCALGELDRAREIYGRIKGIVFRRATRKQCAELGASLAP